MSKSVHQVIVESDFLQSYNFLKGPIRSISYGDGHINDTYRLIDGRGSDYILQRINTTVFKDPQKLMQNILKVTAFIKSKGSQSLSVHVTQQGLPYYCDSNGDYWRLYTFVHGMSPTHLCGASLLKVAGKGFGAFLVQLADFPIDSLHETIPGFHNTPMRMEQLKRAYKEDRVKRANIVAKEYAFALQFEREVYTIEAALEKGDLPKRVTHNDTKVNNVLINSKTNTAICVLDLDTLMPGSALYDYGDGIRSSVTLTTEDEPNLDKVQLSIERFEAFTSGYLEGARDVLTPLEIQLLPMSAILMTLECGMRFLADYLEGDVYFKTHTEDHNLRRARTQFKLVEEMTFNYERLQEIVAKYTMKKEKRI